MKKEVTETVTNDKTERARGLGRKTRDRKGELKTILRFKTGEGVGHQTSPASLWGSQEDNVYMLISPQKGHKKLNHVQRCGTLMNTFHIKNIPYP